MSNLMHAARIYRAASEKRSPREREADVFRRATGVLRTARDGGPIDRARALADNQLLWATVRILVRDPSNRLEAVLKGALSSLAICVQREMDREAPDFEFLIAVNENIAAGLSGE